MITGRILQFDHTRGYGFLAADDGGEDIFLHASVFDGEPDDLAPGIRVEFQIMEGDRGRKAFAAHLIDEPEAAGGFVPLPHPVPMPPLPVASAAVAQPLPPLSEPDDDQMCDVLSAEEFGRELTELLISTVPELTGQQILEVRQNTLEFAKKHGWCEG